MKGTYKYILTYLPYMYFNFKTMHNGAKIKKKCNFRKMIGSKTHNQKVYRYFFYIAWAEHAE